MATLTAQFVDSISDTAGVRLDLNDGAVWSVLAKSTATPPPPLRRAVASTLLVDGDRYAAAAYGSRVIEIALELKVASLDTAATHVRALTAEVQRAAGFLRWRPGTTRAVYFRLVRGEYADVRWDGVSRRVTVRLPAEPYAYGPEVRPLGDPIVDTFTRITANGWGILDSGQAWAINTVNAAAADYSTDGTKAAHIITGAATNPESTLAAVPVDVDILISGFTFGGTPSTSNHELDVRIRDQGNGSSLETRLFATPAGTCTINVRENLLGGEIFVSGFPAIPGVTPASKMDIQIQAVGPVLRARAWATGTARPAAWQVSIRFETALPAGSLAIRAESGAGNVYPVTFTYDAVTITPVMGIANDPAVAGVVLNSNPYFETNAAGWTPFGGTFVRSTAQSKSGAASGLLTPNGIAVTAEVTSDPLAAVASKGYRFSSWVRCAVARNVRLTGTFHDAGAAQLGVTASATIAVAANTWTPVEATAIAPATTATARIWLSMDGTPAGSNLLYIDESTIREECGPGSMYADLTGILGDVETPLILRGDQVDVNALTGTALGVRRRGDVTLTRALSQAETWALGTDTTVQPDDGSGSGVGSTFTRTTFATATMQTRLSTTFPQVPNAATRGLYRVFMRYRRSSAAADTEVNVRLTSAGVANTSLAVAKVTTFAWMALGTVAIPGGTDPGLTFAGAAIGTSGVALVLAAEKVGPSAVNLEIDCLVFVPADDGFALVDWSSHGTAGWTVLDGTLEAAYPLALDGTVAAVNPPPAYAGGLPVVTPGQINRLYLVQRALGGFDLLTQMTVLQPSYHPRYLFVRPVTE